MAYRRRTGLGFLVGAALPALTASVAHGAIPVEGPSADPKGTITAIVRLEDAPLAAYMGGIDGFPATSPGRTGAARLDARSTASQRYRAYLARKHAAAEAAIRRVAPAARVLYRYANVLNGLAVAIPSSRVADLDGLHGVVGVSRDRLLQPASNGIPDFIGATNLWNELGGQENAGEGVIVGVIDSGIWPEHPSFADDGSYKPPLIDRGQCSFGVRASNPNDDPFDCNNKLIGAYAFLDAYKANLGLFPGEFDSARDSDGHGTATAQIAAGNAGVPASIYGISHGTVSGIAPRAHIAAYKAVGARGGFASDLAAAIDQAVADGVDVINYSIAGGSGDPYDDSVALAFLFAADAGVFVATSAGNGGPDPGTIGATGNAPWVTTVGASSLDTQHTATVTLTAGTETLKLDGASITPGAGPAPAIDGGSCDAANQAWAGHIVLCERGEISPVVRSFWVNQSDGVGAIVYNTSTQPVSTDNHYVPTVHLDQVAGQALREFVLRRSDAVVEVTGWHTNADEPDVLHYFSARGGVDAGQGSYVTKPDITAPGVQVLAGTSPAALIGQPGELFQAITGTSGSAPHVAGSAALIRALHPDWTPGQIRSALMTTADQVFGDLAGTVVPPRLRAAQGGGREVASPLGAGSGRIDLTAADDPGLTFDVRARAFLRNERTPWKLNLPSVLIPEGGPNRVKRTVRSVLERRSVWRLRVNAPDDLGVRVPKKLRVGAGRTKRFTIRIDASEIPDGEVRHATLILRQQGGPRRLHIPITVAG